MANHKKPSREELKAGMDASLKKLETLPPVDPPAPQDPPNPPQDPPNPPAPPTPPNPPAPPNPPNPPIPPALDLSKVRTKKLEELTPEEKTFVKEHAADLTDEERSAFAVTVPPPKPPIDYEKKFKESSREVQIIQIKEKEMAKAQEEADKLPEPTDDEMKVIYPNWDQIDQLTKDLAKDRILNKKKNDILNAARSKYKNVLDWGEKVDKFVGDPAVLAAHPELEGKTDEFRTFANKATRHGVDFEDLLLAFAGEQAKTVKPNHSGQQMFETGAHRAPAPPAPKDDKITLAQGEQLRKTDYKKFLQLLKAGKIATV